MTDSLERFLEDLHFEVPAGLAHRAKAGAAADDRPQVPNRRDTNWQRQPWALTLVAAVLALAIVATLILGARALHPKALVPGNPIPKALIPSDPIPPSVAANGWIAYSTDGPNPGATDITTGSDIYLVRAGVEPRLVAGRDGGKIRNMCPTFSPDGRRLAYGVDAASGRALVVLGVDANSAITDTVRFPIPGSGSRVCPRWSSDGKRVAYLEGGTVIVRGLDGSTLAAVAGDPRVTDFGLGRQLGDPLLSPRGDRIVWQRVSGNDCQIVVARPDRTATHVVPQTCGYLATWSPDGRQVLRTQDVGGIYYSLQAIAMDSPFGVVTIVSSIRTNGARSAPGWGDVSWQPVLQLSSIKLPANGLIAVSANPWDVGGGQVGDIYLVAEGAAARRIIGSDRDGVAQACPRFSPDGRRLAYGEARASDPVSTYRGVWPVSNRAVVVVGVNDHGDPSPPVVRVTLPTDPGQIACPRWSPSGRQVAFRVGSELWVADASSGATTVFPVTESPWAQQGFVWSRDGSRIAVAEPGKIRVVPIDGGASTLIPVKGTTPRSLSWTAGDDRIIYISSDVPGDGLAVNVVGVGGNHDTQLTPVSADLQLRFYDAVVSPDGTRVAYLQRTYRCANNSCSQDPERLLIISTNGSSVVEPPIPPGFGVSGPQWSPDGKRLLFGSISGVVSVGVTPGSSAVVYSSGKLNLEWSGSEVTWQPVPF